MSFFRSVLLASFISLLAALALLFLGSAMGYEEFRGGYAVLTIDASINDRDLRSLLEPGEYYFGGTPVSESSQWVMLDEFDSLRRIPLDQYSSRIFPFDPRNDGYADKVREVFVNDNDRFIYIPLMPGNWNSKLLDKKFNELLGDIPYTVDYYGIGRPLALFFIVYAAASVCLLILCYLNRKVHRSIVNIIPMIPVLSSLGFFGAAGIGSAAVLFALFIMLKEPLNELVNPPPLREKKLNFKVIYKEIILPFRFYWFFLPIFAAALAILVVFSQLKLLFLLAVSGASFAVFFFSLKIVSTSGIDHRRFNPLMIMRRKFPEFVFPMYILPFVAGAFFTMFFTPYMSGSFDYNKKFDTIISEQSYYEHLTYQASFSTRQMGTSSAAFPDFYFDTDGLPSMDRMRLGQSVRMSDFPAFPLRHLMEFFNNVNNGVKTDTGTGSTGLSGKLSLLVLLLFLFPGFIANKLNEKAPKINFDGIKRFTGKLRLIGLNWNKALLYNKKNYYAPKRMPK
ncbi:MAG: hypothetical protein FWD22_04965 [Treponema sp.]|nr:hypothetical protein [Treponema sp.]